MKPKLIILNGALASGKSTLAVKYAGEHPLTLKLDIDELRRWISHFREDVEVSRSLSRKMANEMARVHLDAGHDVVIAQIFTQQEPLNELESIAKECNADYYEIFISLSKEGAIERFIKRGQNEGYADGFRPEGLVALGGREKKIEQMYRDVMMFISERPHVKILEPIEDDIDGTYQKLLECIK